MANAVTKALYDFFSEEDKSDFYPAYIYLKHIKHFAHYAKEAAGLPSEEPEEAISEDVELMLRMTVQRIGETALSRDTSSYHLKVMKLDDAIQLVTQKEDVCLDTPERVMPYKQAKDIILNNPESIAVGECVCRSTSAHSCLPPPMETCLFVGDPQASFLAEENPKFRKIPQDEAVAILRDAHDKGFVHCAEFKKDLGGAFVAICNCCSCCCLGVQMWNTLGGTVPILSSSGYLASVNEECDGCGICLDSCKFEAMSLEAGADQVTIQKEKCMGCGMCEDVCPPGAITLELDPSKGAPLDLSALLAEQKRLQAV